MKKKLYVVFALSLALCMLMNSALACTALYVGSAVTQDGSVIFGRSEDLTNSYNKLFYVSPAGNHTAGEEYNGCYGFTWTFTHDSYGYTAFSDDNGSGVDFVCPDCDGTHKHTPYEAAGTNDQGLSITATETLYCAEALEEVDPYEELGIEEAEIVTVVLSEAATAQEAVNLLLGIYDTAGANAGSGILIADSTETWYVENVTGHQYIALKLPDTLVLAQPNMSIIGAIDLDDTENVIASEGIIAIAQQAGTFAGDEAQNVIDYVQSYNGGSTPNARMINALAYLDPAYADTETQAEPAAYLLTNLDENGQIVTLHNGIHPAEALSIADAQDFFHIINIGYVRNLDTHLFQISGAGATGTVEWVAMNDTALSVFVPYYPMLTTAVDASYMVSTPEADFTSEAVSSSVCYLTTINTYEDGQRVTVEGFRVLPENWQESMYWSFDALSNLVMYGGLAEEQVNAVCDAVYAQQAQVNAAFAEAKATLTDADAATAWSMQTAQEIHQLAVDLANDLLAK